MRVKVSRENARKILRDIAELIAYEKKLPDFFELEADPIESEEKKYPWCYVQHCPLHHKPTPQLPESIGALNLWSNENPNLFLLRDKLNEILEYLAAKEKCGKL